MAARASMTVEAELTMELTAKAPYGVNVVSHDGVTPSLSRLLVAYRRSPRAHARRSQPCLGTYSCSNLKKLYLLQSTQTTDSTVKKAVQLR